MALEFNFVDNVAQFVKTQVMQIIASDKDNIIKQRIEEAIEIAFQQLHIEEQNLINTCKRQNLYLQLVNYLHNEYSSAYDMRTMIIRTCELIPKYTEADLASIYLYNEQQNSLINGAQPYLGRLNINLFNLKRNVSPIAEKCFKERAPVIVNDWSIVNFIDLRDDAEIKSTFVAPIIISHKVIGVLQIDHTKNIHRFADDEIDFYKLICEKISSAIININLFSKKGSDEKDSDRIDESYYQIYEDIPIGLFRSQPDGMLLKVNNAMVQILGYPDRKTLLDTNASRLYADPQERIKWQAMVETYGVERETEVCLRRYDGTYVWVQHSSRVTRGADGKILYYNGAIIDISERMRAETQIHEAVKEKEVLLKEIHHRVKNNLQIISSLLNLQSDYLRDPYDKEMFKQSQNRVKAMALLHEKLYQSPELTRIDFDEYLRSLMPTLFQSYKTTMAEIECIIETDGMLLDIDTAIPCGLIVGELVANSLKHAFPQGKTGSINVGLKHIDDRTLQLSVQDDGIGMDKNVMEISNAVPMGWELINMLSEQLGGKIEIENQKGTRVRIIFKERNQKEGIQNQWQIPKF